MTGKKTIHRPGIPELLAPAGTMEKMQTAIHYGADAVYLGGSQFSLRARAGNFDDQAIAEAVAYAHGFHVLVYVTINIFAHNRDLEGLGEYLILLRDAGVDGLIVADPGILLTCREVVPEMPVHLSTQANVTNAASARFWAGQGVRRLNLARELGRGEILQIRQASDVELEIFVHGALCISYSGRCMLSSYFTGRDANKGDCAHPCRYSYSLVEEKRPGQYFPVEEDERGTYIFNSQDLCLLERLPQLIAAGADAVKIEGRMKSMGYVGATVRVYRAALDYIQAKLDSGQCLADIHLPDEFGQEISKIGTRGHTENFFDAPPTAGDMMYDTMRIDQPYAPVGIVRQTDPTLVEARNVLETGDMVEYLGRELQPFICHVTGMKTPDGEPVERANPGNRVIITTEPCIPFPEKLSILRKQLTVAGQNK